MRELTVSAELDSRLLDAVDVAVIAVDAEGVVIRWNRQAELIYGWPAADALGRRLTELAVGARDVRHEVLSDREYEVFCLLGSGRTVKEIAGSLQLSPKTVSTYRTRVLEKMHAASNADLVRYAALHGLIR